MRLIIQHGFIFASNYKEENKMVYFLIDKSSDWYCGEEFWIFESYVSELVKALDLLNHTAFLDNGWLDYYVVSKNINGLSASITTILFRVLERIKP